MTDKNPYKLMDDTCKEALKLGADPTEVTKVLDALINQFHSGELNPGPLVCTEDVLNILEYTKAKYLSLYFAEGRRA